MNGKNKKRVLVAILAVMVFASLVFFKHPDLNTVNAAANSMNGILLDKIYQKINQSGYTEDTLANLKKAEELVYKQGADNSLYDVQRCYNAYVYNLIFLNKQKEAGPIMNRWNTALESVYQSAPEVTSDFAMELELDCDNLFNIGLLLGPEYDPLLLKHTQNRVNFYEKRMAEDPDIPRFYLQNALNSLSYALLYNRKYEDYSKIILRLIAVEDQQIGALPEEFMPFGAYKYLLKGDYEKCLEIINNVILVFGDTKDEINQRTGTNEVINDLYQMKKRNIESKNIDRLLAELPEPILNVIKVNANSPGDKCGMLKGDQIIKYQGVKCLSYYHFMDLVAANSGDPKIELEIIRDGKTIVLTVPSGRLGISIGEDIKK